MLYSVVLVYFTRTCFKHTYCFVFVHNEVHIQIYVESSSCCAIFGTIRAGALNAPGAASPRRPSEGVPTTLEMKVVLVQVSLQQWARRALRRHKMVYLRGHSSITSSRRWVGGVKKGKFLMIYSTVNHQRVGWVGLKKSKTWWRNTWMPPYQNVQYLRLVS